MDNYPRKRRAYSQPDSLSAPVDRLPYFPTPPLDDIPEYVQYAPPLKNISDHPQVDSLSNLVGVTPYTGPIYQSDLNPRYANGYADSYADGLPSTPLDNYQSAKRPRRSTNFSMAPPQSAHPSSQDGHENLHPLNGLPLRSNAASGWTMSRIAHCFANPFMCPQSDVGDSPPPAYRAIPTPYDCLPSRAPPMLDTSSAPFQAQAEAPPMSAQMVPKQVGVHVCNELEWQHVAEKWPPLQPSQVVGFQPHTGREEMIYPSPPPYGLSTPYYNTSPSIKSETASSAYFGSSGHGSPYEQQQDAYANIPVSAHYHETQGYATGETVEQQVDGQGEQTALDLVPHKGPSKRKAFSDPELRAKTAQTRKIGSCIRCRMQRIRCVLDEENQTGPCIPCKRAMANSRVPKFDCIRRKIPDVKLFKPGQVPGFEWTSRWKGNIVENIETWVSKSRRYIYVTEGYTGKSVRLLCGEFVPQEGDKIVRTWVDSDGVTQKRVIPSYAIADMDAAKQGFVDYVSSKRGVMECCRKLMSEKLFLHKTYGLAIEKRYTATTETERNVLGNTLDLWMSIRMTTKSFEIVGQDKLGMPDNIINDPTQDLYNKIPIPPVMGAQIDMILIHEIQPQLRRKVLDDLQKLVLKKDAYTWMTVYLVCFILLHNAALITEHDAKYARKHGMDRRFAREGEVIDYNSSATTLLAYFHYVNRGVYPFSDECNDIDLMNLARLNSDEMELVRFSRQFAAKHKEDWEGLWTGKCYENEYFYLSQLFEQNWEAKPWAV